MIYINKIKRIMGINLLVFLGNIAMGLFGFGYFTYPDGKFGIKGFFFAGNEVSIVFLCLFYYLLSRIKYKKRYVLIIYIVALIIALLIGTKTCFIACCLLSVIDYYYRLTRKGKPIFTFCFPALVFILISSVTCFLHGTEFYEFVYFNISSSLEKKEGLLNALLSGRITFLGNNYRIWIDNFTLSTFLFGFGNSFENGIEIDFFDVLFNHGIIFLLLTLCFYLFIIYIAWRKNKKRLFFFNLIYFFISLTAGHVWSGVMAGLFFAYLNAYEINNFGYLKASYKG